MVTGLTTMPDSNFLTWRTCSACSAGDRLRWMTPMPPAWAMAMASRDSVTVSIAADRIGSRGSMSPAMRVRTSVSPGMHLGMAGLQQHVVEGQRQCAGCGFDDLCHGQSPDKCKWRGTMRTAPTRDRPFQDWHGLVPRPAADEKPMIACGWKGDICRIRRPLSRVDAFGASVPARR